MIRAADIVKVAPAAARYAPELVRQMAEAGIMDSQSRAAMFLGQIHVESGGFTRVVENLNYRAPRLLEVFRGRNGLKTLSQAQALVEKGPDAIANWVYGGPWGEKNLGNKRLGDGWRFIGRGLKQLTGRFNYGSFSRSWLGDDSLLSNPDRVAEPDGAVASAVWFWSSRDLNAEADRGTVRSVTKIVNGGYNGLPEREQWTARYRALWADRPDFSNVISGADTVPGVAR